MNKKNDKKSLSDEELFRQTVGFVHPIKSHRHTRVTPNQRSLTNPSHSPLSILQNSPHKKKNTVENRSQNDSPPPPSSPSLYRHPKKNRSLTRLEDLLDLIEDDVGGYTHKTYASLDELKFNRRGNHCPLFRQLKKGKIPVAWDLDLHHHTIPEAKLETLKTILEAYQNHLSCVRIIHGKGHHTKDGISPLKWAINHWLRQVPMVRAFCSCMPKDGGTGAVYVLLQND